MTTAGMVPPAEMDFVGGGDFLAIGEGLVQSAIEVELKRLNGLHQIYAVRLMQRVQPPIEQVSPHA